MKKTKKIIALTVAAAFGLFCLAEPVSAKDAADEGILRCLGTVIPSLYAMMIASGLLLRTGAVSAAGRLADRLSRLIFGMDGETFGIFLFSMTAGYPVGARLIGERFGSGKLTRRFAELSSGLCFGAGSAFIFGCAANGSSYGGLLLISTVSANVIAALLMSRLLRKLAPKPDPPRKTAVSAGMLSDAVSSAGRGMAEICFAVTGFSVLTAMLRRIGAIPLIAAALSGISDMRPESADSVICAILDVTAVSALPHNDLSLLPVTAALISFGGACVFVQIAAIFRGKLRLLPLIAIRAVTSALSFVICRGLLPFFIRGEVVSAAAMTPQLHREPSPIPSLMLVVMTVFLLAAEKPVHSRK